jgi:hypothetical protein
VFSGISDPEGGTGVEDLDVAGLSVFSLLSLSICFVLIVAAFRGLSYKIFITRELMGDIA